MNLYSGLSPGKIWDKHLAENQIKNSSVFCKETGLFTFGRMITSDTITGSHPEYEAIFFLINDGYLKYMCM